MNNVYKENIEQKIFPWAKELIAKLKFHCEWTFDHSIRVGIISSKFASHLKLSINNQNLLLHSGLLHDIGKIYVSKKILDSPNKLNIEEKRIIENHICDGFDLIKKHNLEIAKIIVAHHEFQDAPYPRKNNRLNKLDNLVNMQKLLALSDSIDGMMSDRPYQKAKTEKQVFEILSKEYDPFLLNLGISFRNKII